MDDVLLEKMGVSTKMMHMKECAQYIPTDSTYEGVESLNRACRCGEFPSGHMTSTQKILGEHEDYFIVLPTEVYGLLRFRFLDFPHQSTAAYVRLAVEDVNEALEIVRCGICVDHPDTTMSSISLITSEKMQRLRKEQINTISEGLIEVAQTAKALISMNGFDWEPANQIGCHFWMNCFHRYAEKNEQPPLPYVSIVPWGDITNRHQISQKANVVDYAPNTLDGMLPSLSRYQRLILMVDDGLRFCHADSKCDSFRVAFEKAIEQLAKGKDNNVRSSVAVLIGGDLTCLLAVERRLSADIPVVICTGTGGLADVLAYVKRSGLVNETGSTAFMGKLKQRLLLQLRELQVPESGLEDAASRVRQLVSSDNMVTFWDASSGESLTDAIVCSLTKCTPDGRALFNLAVVWSRADLLMSTLEAHPKAMSQDELSALFVKSIVKNDLPFVRTLRDFIHSFSCINTDLLTQMLTDSADCDHLARLNATLCFDQSTQRPDLEHVLTCLREFNMKLFKHPILPLDLQDSKTGAISLEDPWEVLFMASVYLGRVEMAEYFWTLCRSPICLALIASCIFRTLGDDLAFDRFQTLANAVAEEGFSINAHASIDLVGGSVMAGWSSPSILELAASAECKTFTSSRPAQQAINYLWSGGINCNALVYLLTLFCPPLFLVFPGIIHFSESFSFGLDNSDWQMSDELPRTFFERLQRFYGCPRTKFCWSFLVCLFFLVISSVTLLLPLQPENVGRTEIAFMVLIGLRLVGSVLSLITGFQWAWIQCLSASLALIYMLLRIWGTITFAYAYSIAVIVLMLFSMELLLYCYVSVVLGPKVTMIGQMTLQLISFLPFFIIFLIAFGVTEQAVLFPDRTGFDANVLLAVFERPFYRLFGENAVNEATGKGAECTEPANSTACPQQNVFAVLSIGMYNIFTVVLLMNLLIAIFSQIFDSLQQDSTKAWQFKRYAIVRSFHQLSAVPWPLGPFVQFFSFLHRFYQRRLRQIDAEVELKQSSRCTDATPCVDKDILEGNAQLLERRDMFEGYCRDQTVSNMAKAEANSDAAQFSAIKEELWKLDEAVTAASLTIHTPSLEATEIERDLGCSITQLPVASSAAEHTSKSTGTVECSILDVQPLGVELDVLENILDETMATISQILRSRR